MPAIIAGTSSDSDSRESVQLIEQRVGRHFCSWSDRVFADSDSRGTHVKVLIVADESLSALHLADDVEQSGHAVLGYVPSTGAGLLLARSEKPHAAIIDLDLRFTADGLDLARALHSMAIPCIVATGDAHMANAAADVATATVRKPLVTDEVSEALRAANAASARARAQATN